MFPIFIPPPQNDSQNKKIENFISLRELNKKPKQTDPKTNTPLGGFVFILVMLISFVSKTNMPGIYIFAIINFNSSIAL